jgi:hypothetical protein
LSGIFLVFGAGISVAVHAADASATTASHLLPPLVTGDEPIAVTEHRIQSAHGPLVRFVGE